MPLNRRRSNVKPLSNINLVPLLDVCFNLLIAFMIVAPTLRTGITIDLPKVTESQRLPPERKSFTISIKKPEGRAPTLYLQGDDGQSKAMDDLRHLRQEVRSLHSRFRDELDIIIEADRLAPCESMLQVLNMTRELGVKSVGVLTESEKSATEPAKP
jgi:biopolymer transport protein TolR